MSICLHISFCHSVSYILRGILNTTLKIEFSLCVWRMKPFLDIWGRCDIVKIWEASFETSIVLHSVVHKKTDMNNGQEWKRELREKLDMKWVRMLACNAAPANPQTERSVWQACLKEYKATWWPIQKRKIDTENCVIKDEWTEKYFTSQSNCIMLVLPREKTIELELHWHSGHS